jgi:hypothetical protein
VRQDLFEILNLPQKPIDLDGLTAAYRDVRKLWFFRQYDPEYLIEAREHLEQIDEAFQSLKDPKRQGLILRELQARKRSDTKPVPVVDAAAPSHEAIHDDVPPAINRSKIVRQLLREAEDMVSQTRRPLSSVQQESLRQKAYEMGLPFDDAEEVIPRIVRQVEP